MDLPRRALLVLACALAAGCLGTGGGGERLLLGTTTSLDDSGLLDALLPAFERDTGIRAQAVVGGTGEILEKAKRGDVDALLTHSPARERAMLAEGWTLSRRPVMVNLFAIAGPAGDPAGVRGAPNASAALARIRANESLFASRGDGSGTHEREVALWEAAGLDPASFAPAWYKETGSGQGTTLLFAAERGAYLLVDQGTLREMHAAGRASSVVDLFHEGRDVRNQYAVSTMNPARAPAANAAAGALFADWIVGERGQAAIASFAIDGEPLFTPNAREEDA